MSRYDDANGLDVQSSHPYSHAARATVYRSGDAVVVVLRGARGGYIGSIDLTMADARLLRERLDRAIREGGQHDQD